MILLILINFYVQDPKQKSLKSFPPEINKLLCHCIFLRDLIAAEELESCSRIIAQCLKGLLKEINIRIVC